MEYIALGACESYVKTGTTKMGWWYGGTKQIFEGGASLLDEYYGGK